MEKVVTSKQLRLSVETEEERRARLENDSYQTAQFIHGDGRRKRMNVEDTV